MVDGTIAGPFLAIAHEFHDDSIYGMNMISPDPDHHDWLSEFELDIDHIDEWIQEEDGRFRFRLCQAKLHVESVSDLSVSFAFPQSTITPLSIDRMTRSEEPVWVHGTTGTADTLGFARAAVGSKELASPSFAMNRSFPSPCAVSDKRDALL